MTLRKSRKGFTLIELLVVIAIIAILAAILFPIFLAAKKKALETRCLGNLQQIGIATNLYMSDTNDVFPLYWDNAASNGAWFEVIKKYSKTPLVAQCPADPNKISNPKAPDYWKNSYTDYWSGCPGIAGSSPNSSAIMYKRTTVYLMDGPLIGDAHHTWWGPPTTWGPTDEKCKESEIRHGSGANVLFCDWHIKLVKQGDFKTTSRIATGNPLISNLNIPTDLRPKGKWVWRNDGNNPWFRGD